LAVGQYQAAIASGPVTDFRGELTPQTGSALSVSSFEGWAVAAYLELTMAKFSPGKFLQEVRVEADKVTWPTRRETLITTAMVFVMVLMASIFFLVADQIIRIAITFVLGIGS
jgi:preprotein translocase subunit SecE